MTITRPEAEELLRGARDRQIALLDARLAGPEGLAVWERSVVAATRALLDAPLRSLVDREATKAVLRTLADAAFVRAVLVPLLAAAVREGLTRLSARTGPLSDLVSAAVRDDLLALMAEPDILPEPLVRELLSDPAVELVMLDVLFDALKKFSERVNPFTADWGLPAVLDRLPALARGPVKKSFVAMRGDFDRRLEPEIRRFLSGSSRGALQRATELVISRQDEPEFVALRQHVVTALLKQPLSQLVWPPADPRGAHLSAAVAGALAAPELQGLCVDLLEHALDATLRTHGDLTTQKAAATLGIDTEAIPFEALARAAWPAVVVALRAPAFRGELEALIDAAHANVLDTLPDSPP